MAKRKNNKESSSCLGICVVILLTVILFNRFKNIIVFLGGILFVIVLLIFLKQKKNNKTKNSISSPHTDILSKNDYSYGTSYTNISVRQNTVNVSFTEVVILPEEVSEMKKSYVSIDIDTTGLDPDTDKIIGLSAVKYSNGQIVDKFHALVNPEILLSDETMGITGITNEMLSSARNIKEVLRNILSFINSDNDKKPVFCVHYADFTIRFLENAFRKNRISVAAEYVDIMDIATYCIPQLKSKKLFEICKAFDIEYEKNGSLSDALAIAGVFTKMLELYPNKLTKWGLYKEEKPIKTFIVTKSADKLISNLFILPGALYVGVEAKIKYKHFDDYYYLAFDDDTEYCKVPKRICDFLEENGYDNQYFVIDKEETEDDKLRLKIGIYKKSVQCSAN